MKKAEEYNSKIIDEVLNSVSSKEAKKVEKNMVLASKIYDAMKAKGWNKTDLAEALDKNNSVITKWLSGTHNFTTNTLYDIEEVLGISIIPLDEVNITQNFSAQISVLADSLDFVHFQHQEDKKNYNQYCQLVINNITNKNSNYKTTCKS